MQLYKYSFMLQLHFRALYYICTVKCLGCLQGYLYHSYPWYFSFKHYRKAGAF